MRLRREGNEAREREKGSEAQKREREGRGVRLRRSTGGIYELLLVVGVMDVWSSVFDQNTRELKQQDTEWILQEDTRRGDIVRW